MRFKMVCLWAKESAPVTGRGFFTNYPRANGVLAKCHELSLLTIPSFSRQGAISDFLRDFQASAGFRHIVDWNAPITFALRRVERYES